MGHTQELQGFFLCFSVDYDAAQEAASPGAVKQNLCEGKRRRGGGGAVSLGADERREREGQKRKMGTDLC